MKQYQIQEVRSSEVRSMANATLRYQESGVQNPYLAKILLYPIKSLDGIEVEKAIILSSGALQYNREFAFVDAQNRFVNGKRYPQVHLLRSHQIYFDG